jgi:hypothetical protein
MKQYCNKLLTLVYMDIHSTKVELIRLILEIESPRLIERISSLLKKETSDFWDELTLEDQINIDQAIQELESGKGMDWDEFKKSIA